MRTYQTPTSSAGAWPTLGKTGHPGHGRVAGHGEAPCHQVGTVQVEVGYVFNYGKTFLKPGLQTKD